MAYNEALRGKRHEVAFSNEQRSYMTLPTNANAFVKHFNHVKVVGNIKKPLFRVVFLVSWQCPIFPGRLQPSIFGDEKLNFCVRDENRWTFSLSSPEMVYLVIAHEISRLTKVP